MTEKRFINRGKDIFQYGEWWCSANGEHCAEVIAEALNMLFEKNDELKKENKQLKVENKELKHQLSQQEMEYATTAYRQAEENGQLRYQNELLSDELEQCKAVVDKKWSEYLKKKGLL